MTNFAEKYIFNCSALLITTDLEPDDVIALQILFKKLKEASFHKPIMVIVGEGDPSLKLFRMNMYANLFAPQLKMEVLQGIGSDRFYSQDGQEFFTPECINSIRDSMPYSEKSLLEKIKQFLTFHFHHTTIINLKPPRELIKIWLEDNELFDNTIFLGYMGFNLRCLLEHYEKNCIQDFLNSFKKVMYYECSMAIGRNNNISSKDGFNFGMLPGYIEKLMQMWNQELHKECSEIVRNFQWFDPNWAVKLNESGLQTYLEHETNPNFRNILARNFKVMKDIKEADFVQFVNADTGLIISLFLNLDDVSFYKGDLTIDKLGIGQPIKNESGKHIFIHNVDDINKAIFRNQQLQFLIDFYKLTNS